MTSLLIIAACMFGGIVVGRSYERGRYHDRAMSTYQAKLMLAAYGTDDPRDWSREIGPAALQVVK